MNSATNPHAVLLFGGLLNYSLYAPWWVVRQQNLRFGCTDLRLHVHGVEHLNVVA